MKLSAFLVNIRAVTAFNLHTPHTFKDKDTSCTMRYHAKAGIMANYYPDERAEHNIKKSHNLIGLAPSFMTSTQLLIYSIAR